MGCLGRGIRAGDKSSYDICPAGTRRPYTYMDLNLEDGRPIHFRRISRGTDYADVVFRHEQTASEFFGAQIAWNGNGWTLNLGNGRKVLFPEAYYAKNFAQDAPAEMQDAAGNRVRLLRDAQRKLQQLISPAGHAIRFKYDDVNRIVEAADDAGNVRNYAYDTSGHLQAVSSGSSPVSV